MLQLSNSVYKEKNVWKYAKQMAINVKVPKLVLMSLNCQIKDMWTTQKKRKWEKQKILELFVAKYSQWRIQHCKHKYG